MTQGTWGWRYGVQAIARRTRAAASLAAGSSPAFS